VPIVTVSSWTQLVDELYKESWDESIQRFRSPFVFRGVPDAAVDLSTTLMRLAVGHEDISSLERHILRNFRKYAHSDATLGTSVWNWLAIAQHHGLQTRLLDWSYSPFVAMHFMTADLNRYDRDGVIWCINHRVANGFLPDKLKKEAESAGSDAFTAEMLDRVAPTLEEFDNLAPKPFLLFLEPPSLDPRIANQFALFSVISSPTRSLDEWIEEHPDLARKVIVPANLKWEIRDKLDQAGMSERVLYPGLDGLARWLSRYYTVQRKR
jgi:hypothetical protein